MTDRTEHEVPTILAIPQPAVRRVIAIVAIAIFLTPVAILMWKLGFERFFESLAYFSATWLLIFMVSPLVAIFARLAFPPKGSLPRLEASRSYARIAPGQIARLFAEKAVEIALSPQSRKILLCHCLWEGLGDGLRLVVRDANGAERQIRATPLDGLSAWDAQVLAEGVSAATGLPVLLSTRSRQADGTVREMSWPPASGWTRTIRGAALAMGTVPLIGGAVVGVLRPAPFLILTVGLGLWLSQMGLLSLLARRNGSRAKFPTLYSLTTVFTFAATYGFAVIVVGFIFRGQ